MYDFDRVLKRADIQQLRSFILEGIDLEDCSNAPDERTYEQRRAEGEKGIYRLLEKTFPDGDDLDDAVRKLSEALYSVEKVYMELGIRAGARLMFTLLHGEN